MSVLNLLSAFLITSVSLLALKPVANRIGLMDVPGGRKQHEAPTPLIGGLGIYAGTLGATVFMPAALQHYGAMLAVSGLVLFTGIFDDLHELRVSIRMASHLVAAWLMAVWAGNQLLTFGDLLGFGPIEFSVLVAVPLTLFATVGVINAINMTDGLDGLSGGQVLISLTFLGVVAFLGEDLQTFQYCALLGCAILAFLRLNFRYPWKQSALIYLGDAGSTMLGFMLAWLIVDATQGGDAVIPPVYALWFLAVPLIDTVSLLIKRPLQGKSPFHPGTDHLHHRLLQAGLTQGQTVAALYSAGIVLGGIGLVGYLVDVRESVMFASFMGLFCLYMVSDRIWRRV